MATNNSLNQYSEVLAVGDQTLAEGSATAATPLWVQDDQNDTTAIGCFNRNNTAAQTSTESRISCHAKLNGGAQSQTEGGMSLGNDLYDNASTFGTNAQNRVCIFTNEFVDGQTFYTDKNSGTSAFEWRTGDAGVDEGDQVGNITNAGQWSYPQQPSVIAQAALQSNVTGDGTAYTLQFTTEIIDRAGAFATSTYTLPATSVGTHMVMVGGIIALADVSAAINTDIQVIASNRTMVPLVNRVDSLKNVSNDLYLNFFTVVDMEASDTFTVALTMSGGGKIVDVGTSSFLYVWDLG